MKKLTLVTMAVMLALSTVLFARSAPTARADESKILEFNTMVGVPRPYTGATNKIRDLSGGGVPWVIESGFGKLKPDGDLKVTVKGLVLESSGINPVANFKAIVSCLSKDSAGLPTTVNVPTGLFPADTAGNSQIEETLTLPQPCIAPIIFVTSPTGSWFAATGF